MIRTTVRRVLLFLLVFLWLPVAAAGAEDPRPVRIGVLAYRGVAAAEAEWGAHAAYLDARLAPRTFQIVPLSLDAMSEAVRERTLDFIITNTGHYTTMEAAGHVTRIATRLLAGPEGPLDRFGGAAVARAGRTDLNGYADLRGKTLLVPDRDGFGGWLMHLGEALEQGIELHRAAAAITETGDQEAVVLGVLRGQADAGLVRSDLIESMAAQGKIRLADVKVLNPRREAGYPYALSTKLYPEWPLAQVTGTPDLLAREVLIALLNLPADSEAARAAGLHGWAVPLSYKAVDELFRTLRVGPYATVRFAFRDVLVRYPLAVAGGSAAIIILLSSALWHIARSRRRLREEVARRAEAEQSLRVLNVAVEQSPSSVVITDAGCRMVYVNDTFCRVSGYDRDEALGRDMGLLRSGLTPPSVYQEMWGRLAAGLPWNGDLCNRRKDGALFWERLTISPVVDADGRTISYLALKQDITLQRGFEMALDRAANYDSLTGLPNRTLAHDRLQRHLVEDGTVAVLHVATDNFTRINQSLGQAAGDAVIAALASRLAALTLETDTVARITGDEFLVIRAQAGNARPGDVAEVERLANAILSSAAQPIDVPGAALRVTVRIGIALAPRDGTDAIEVEKAAYSAALRAREAGGNAFRHFQQSMDAEARRRFELEVGLRAALENDALELYLQPFAEVATGRFVGAEALVRWRREGEGYVPPGVFIPVAESAGLVQEIDRWVIAAAAAAAARLRDRLGRPFPIAVNVSPKDLADRRMIDHIRQTLDRHRLPPDALEVEVTEGIFLAGEDKAAEVLRTLAEMGVPIAVDDFGTGYSSLAYLRKYPFSKLKIDRSFVAGVDQDAKLTGLVNAVTSMASHLGLKVTAEGVEREEELALLRRTGCDLVQGYLLARPMPLAQLETLLGVEEMETA
ncbi:MAG TPA: EAL domain-containing protein [Azospirillum sp.]